MATSASLAASGGADATAPVAAVPPPAVERTVPSRSAAIAIVALIGIAIHLVIRWGAGRAGVTADLPLVVVLAIGGLPLVGGLARKALRREFGSDLLAGLSIVVAALLGEYLAGAVVVLMLSGGEALEAYAVGRASSVLAALARRMPLRAHRRADGRVEEIALDAVRIGDELLVHPHDICPVDGVVIDGRGVMDESYLTGEPFMMPKTPGAEVYSGAINGEHVLTIRARRLAVDSRYARIMAVMREAEQRRPRLRRLGDELGAWYTPLALAIAGTAWALSGDPTRFLAVLVVATPCPLLIAIPIAIIAAISLAAKRGIVIRDPAILERIGRCRTIVLDKTGTLTYGQPALTDVILGPWHGAVPALQLAASLERYSKHPLARTLTRAAAAAGVSLLDATAVREEPGHGLEGVVNGCHVSIVGRRQAEARGLSAQLPPHAGGLECIVIADAMLAATFRFHDAPRADSRSFIEHLGPRHGVRRVLIVSGDREPEVRYLADQVGIRHVYAEQQPEDKVAITRAESARAATLFIGDGINDAPALAAATVGVAFGHHSEITSSAAGAVIMDTALERVDELFHIAARMRRVALQSAIGGMAASVLGMAVASAGLLTPVAGAVVQECIDLAAVLNALRTALPIRRLSDYEAADKAGSPKDQGARQKATARDSD